MLVDPSFQTALPFGCFSDLISDALWYTRRKQHGILLYRRDYIYPSSLCWIRNLLQSKPTSYSRYLRNGSSSPITFSGVHFVTLPEDSILV